MLEVIEKISCEMKKKFELKGNSMIQGLDHIALIVSSEKEISFYEKLGFEVTERIERNYDEIVFMKSENLVLEIFVDKNHPERLSTPEARGLRHLALKVRNLEETIEELKQKGIKTEPVKMDWFGRRFTFVKDPDGQPIELKECGSTPI